MNSCSCLTLILACVIYWQAKEISRVVRWCQPKEGEAKIDITLLEHVSPIEWDSIEHLPRSRAGHREGPQAPRGVAISPADVDPTTTEDAP
jgi:hypothetical protein